MFPIISSFPYFKCCRLVSTEAKIWKHKNSKSNRIPSLYYTKVGPEGCSPEFSLVLRAECNHVWVW
jgi:hypothetical protein